MTRRRKRGKKRATAQALFDAIQRQINTNREKFIARLNRHLRREGDCRLWAGCVDRNGYARINLRVNGHHLRFGVHRMFLTMKLKRPIRDGYEAGHFECNHPLCVVHVQEQTRQENLKDRDGRNYTKKEDDIPF